MPVKPPKPPSQEAAPRFRQARRAKQQTLRTLTREFPSDSDLNQIDAEMDSMPDRAAAIMLAVRVELYLQTSIMRILKRQDGDTEKILIETDGPMVTFYSKICLSYALGIIDETELHNLNIVRAVRNAFAHANRPISFTTIEIEQECSGLYLPPREEVLSEADSHSHATRQKFKDVCYELCFKTLDNSLSRFPS
jgi:DNA-binding MltR family transcriptional regulator